MILAEAQATQRPFVATPVGAIQELAEHGGILVPVGDAETLAYAVIDLLKRPASEQQSWVVKGRPTRERREVWK